MAAGRRTQRECGIAPRASVCHRTDRRPREEHIEGLADLAGNCLAGNSLQELFMNTILRNAMVVAGLAVITPVGAQVVFYEREGFDGRSFTAQRQINDFSRHGFNDRASSVVVMS